MTPLIDVVFILLIFFMLASSFTTWRSVELDTVMAGQTAAVTKSVLVEVKTDGLRFSGRTVEEDELILLLQKQTGNNRELQVLIRFDDALPLQKSVAVLDRLAKAGISGLRILPSPETGQ